MFNLFRHELTSRWVSILGWGIGLALFGSMYVSVYPQMAEEMVALSDVEFYTALGIDMGSFAGYIASVVVQVIPVILGVYVIMISTGTLAGEEDNGTLELVVAMPLPRWQIVSMKAAALSIVIFLIMTIMAAGVAFTLSIIKETTEVDTTPIQLFFALLGAYPVHVAFFSIGLFLGALMPSRRMAVGVMAVFYIASFVGKSITGYVSSMNYLKNLSLFSYVDTTARVFEEGVDPTNILILLSVAVVFFVLALLSFHGRNITVGQWFWQRKQVPTS